MRPVPLAALPDSANVSAVRGAWRVEAPSQKLSLIFTREANGTRNLWQATSSADGDWPLKPLTNFAAPSYADEAQVSNDGRTIICVTNALSADKTAQIARWNEQTGQLEALTHEAAPSHSPALSPDGKSLVFVREMGDTSTIFLLSLTDKTARLVPRRVIAGNRPAWLHNDTLLFSDTRKNSLYRIEIPANWPPLLPLKTKPQGIALRSGEVTAVADGSQLCIALEADRNGNPGRLFFMAPNGSGERVLRNTDGARAPRFAPDGTALLFDAPLVPNGPRTLWVMNLAPVTPIVELTRVTAERLTAEKAALNIIGTVFCEDSPEVDVKIEVGEGAAPGNWQIIAAPKAPLQKESLAKWPLPAEATGDWTLRLTASRLDGDAAQTSMTVTLPLRPGASITNSSPDVSIFVSPVSGAAGLMGMHGIDSQVIPGEWSKGKFVPRGPKTFPEKNRTSVANPGLINPDIIQITPPNQKNFTPQSLPIIPSVDLPMAPREIVKDAIKDDASGGPLQSLPLPALPPPPSFKGAPLDTSPLDPSPVEASAPSVRAPNVTLPENRRSAPLTLENSPVRHNSAPTLGGPKEKPPANLIAKTEAPTKIQTAPKTLPKAPAKRTVASRGDSQIRMDVPDDLKSGADSDVTCFLRNTGKSAWSSAGENPVRLLVRWFDVTTGQRYRWEIKWLTADVEPGDSVPISFTLTPPRSGKLRLNLCVVRLPNGKYQPASPNDNDELDKLAEKTFQVTAE